MSQQENPQPHVCPYWVALLLASPLRRLFENPKKMLKPYVKPGMTVLDVGCALGFFTMPLARLVGAEGRVVAVDLQDRMIKNLRRRLKRANLLTRVDARVCEPRDLAIADLSEAVDFAAAIHVIHETPDQQQTLRQIQATLKPHGQLLLMEPKGHVSTTDFAATDAFAREMGLREVSSLKARRSHALLYKKV